jgi:hypothetical protein
MTISSKSLLLIVALAAQAFSGGRMPAPVTYVNDAWKGVGFKDGKGEFHRADSAAFNALRIDETTGLLADSAKASLEAAHKKQKGPQMLGLIAGMGGAIAFALQDVGLVPAMLVGGLCGAVGAGGGALLGQSASKQERQAADRQIGALLERYNQVESGSTMPVAAESAESSPSDSTAIQAPVSP